MATFLRDKVASFEELETLLLLARSPKRAWSNDEIAESLNVTVEAVDAALDQLTVVGGLIYGNGKGSARVFRFAPASDEIRERVDELVQAYAEQRFAIVQLMSIHAVERIRSSAARGLADAFRFERSKK